MPTTQTPDCPTYRPTWANIDLSAVRANARCIAKHVGPAHMLAMVKANAYGHGAVELAKTLEPEPYLWGLGVATIEEGIELRQADIHKPILVVGSAAHRDALEVMREHQLHTTIHSLDDLQRVLDTPKSHELALHLKFDLSIHRLGIPERDTAKALALVKEHTHQLNIQGLMTHLACAESDAVASRAHINAFEKLTTQIKTPWVHAANSAAAVAFAWARFNLVRPGLALYGVGFAAQHLDLRPALSLKSNIIALRDLPKGEGVGYDYTFRTKKAARIATVALGYADGYRVAMSNRAFMLVGGLRCPVVGRVSMDSTMIDVSHVPHCRVGDEVVVIGEQNHEQITTRELAAYATTHDYEILTAIGSRVPRFYSR